MLSFFVSRLYKVLAVEFHPAWGWCSVEHYYDWLLWQSEEVGLPRLLEQLLLRKQQLFQRHNTYC